MNSKENNNRFKGITYEGQPLEDHLNKQEQAEKTNEANESWMQEVTQTRQFLRRRCIKPKHPSSPEQPGSVIHWPKNRIREEYGIMSNPYDKQIKNVLWVLLHRSPISTNELALELQTNKANIGGLLTRIRHRLSDFFDIEVNRGGPYIYYLKQDAPELKEYKQQHDKVEQLYSLFIERGQRQNLPSPDPDPNESMCIQGSSPANSIDGSGAINIPANININLRIEVLFGLLQR